jgi:outer membrane protein assembly factor BamB
MNQINRIACLLAMAALLTGGVRVSAQDWPQWRGPNRDGKAAGFTAPSAWPKELTQKWKVTVGDGLSTPALVGDKLFVFSRQGSNEIIRCLNAADGKEVWQEKYSAEAVRGMGAGRAGEFAGPRSSPAVADAKVVIYGVQGDLICYNAADGKKLWSKNGAKYSMPRYNTSSSPFIVDNLCIVQHGSEQGGGAIVAYELATGNEKWKWTGDGSTYASPVLATVNETKIIVAETAAKIVGLNLTDGKLLWETSFPAPQMSYNACTPNVAGQTVVFSGAGAGRGTKAVKIEKSDDKFSIKELWSSRDAVQFNSPIIKDGLIYGLSSTDSWFCINLESGKTAWTAPAPKSGGGGGGGGGKMMGGGGRGGYGSVVDAGSVLIGLTPAGKLVVFQPGEKEYKELASYKVADGTFAYPV